jgi:hypothetical protein
MAKVKDSSWLNPILQVLILHLTATRPLYFIRTYSLGLQKFNSPKTTGD